MKDLKVIFIPSIIFFIEKRFFAPFIGSIFLKSGIIAFVVNKNPNCASAATTPATATATESGITIRKNSLAVTMSMSIINPLSTVIPIREK